MSLEERKQVAEITVNQVKNKILVIVHVGTTSTSQSIELAKHASEIGADVIASVPPYYHPHDERDVKKYFDSLVESVDIPVFVYNNPKTTTLRAYRKQRVLENIQWRRRVQCRNRIRAIGNTHQLDKQSPQQCSGTKSRQ